MKLGVIADVHGDLDALRRALKLLHAQGVDDIICAGDLVDKGPATDEIIALIEAEHIASVQGDHDLDACTDGFVYVQHSDRYGIEQTYAQDVTPALGDYLRALPVTLKLDYEGTSILLAHASVWDQRTFLSSRVDASLFQRVAAEATAPIVILGHTHEPLIVNISNECLILNPGCVYYGTPEFLSTCAILSLPSRAFQVFNVDTGEAVEPARVSL